MPYYVDKSSFIQSSDTTRHNYFQEIVPMIPWFNSTIKSGSQFHIKTKYFSLMALKWITAPDIKLKILKQYRSILLIAMTQIESQNSIWSSEIRWYDIQHFFCLKGELHMWIVMNKINDKIYKFKHHITGISTLLYKRDDSCIFYKINTVLSIHVFLPRASWYFG